MPYSYTTPPIHYPTHALPSAHTTLSTIHNFSHTVYLIPYLSRALRNPNRLTLPYPHNTLPIHCPNYSVPFSCTTLIIDYATQITFYRVQQSNKLYRLIRHPMHTPLMHYPIPTHSTTLFYATLTPLYRIKSNHIERQTNFWHSYALSYY